MGVSVQVPSQQQQQRRQQPYPGGHRTWKFLEVPVPNYAGGNNRLSSLRGLPEARSGAYGGCIPCMMSTAVVLPRGCDWCLGAERIELGFYRLFLHSSHASQRRGEACGEIVVPILHLLYR